MAIKLFNRKPELTEDEIFAKLDLLMGKMSSIDIYIEYLELREGMQGRAAPHFDPFVKYLRCD